jgi:HEAT repeat protein
MITFTLLLTYLLQSTVLLGGAWLVSRLLRRHAVVQETVWRMALLGSVVAPLLVAGGVVRPLSGTIGVGDAWQSRDVSADRTSAGHASRLVSAPQASRNGTLRASAKAAGATETGASPKTAREPSPTSHDIDDSNVRSSALPGWYWDAAFTAVWGTTAALLVLWHFLRRRQLFSLLARRDIVTDAAVSRMFADLCASAGLQRAVRLTTSPACPVPMALTSSEVCVPAHFFDALDAEQQRGALAHEVAHVVRRDPRWLTVDALIGALFFVQPLNVVARRALREHAEWQCDDWAARQGAALGLARCLADVATWLQPFPSGLLAVTVPMAVRRSDLVFRVERLLSDAAMAAPTGRLRPVAAACLAVLVVIWTAPAFSAAVTLIPSDSLAAPEPVPVRDALVGSANRTVAVQTQIVRPPGPESLAARWAWAMRDAQARSRRSYWIGYSFTSPLRQRQHHLSDSEGISIDRVNWKGPTLGEALGVDNGIAVLVRYGGGGNASLNRVTHRSMNAPMDFDGAVVYWLGGAEDRESVAWLDGLQQQMRMTSLRSELVEALSMHRTSSIVLPVLERLLGSEPDRAIRAEAAEGLEHHPVPEALRLAHATATRDSDGSVRAEAAEAIGEMPIDGAADALVDLANTAEDPAVRHEAAEALGSQPPDAAMRGIEQVVFQSPHGDARREAVEALGDLDGAVALSLLRRIIWEHPNTSMRVEAVETLGDLEDIDVVGELRDILERHPDPSVRHEALDVLAGADSSASYALILEIASGAASAEARRDAIEAIAEATEKGRSSAEIERAATILEHAIFNDRDEDVQIEAVEALQQFPRQRALALLQKVVETHASRKVRREAVDVIAHIGR